MSANEMQTYLDRKDADAMRACVARYKALLRETNYKKSIEKAKKEVKK